jgi:hypothetical protein
MGTREELMITSSRTLSAPALLAMIAVRERLRIAAVWPPKGLLMPRSFSALDCFICFLNGLGGD